MWDQQVTLTIDFSQVLTPKCHLLLLTVFGDRKVFPQAMKGFKSRGEEGEAGTHTQSTKVPLVRFPIACDVRGNRGSPFPKLLLAPLQRHPKRPIVGLLKMPRLQCWPFLNILSIEGFPKSNFQFLVDNAEIWSSYTNHLNFVWIYFYTKLLNRLSSNAFVKRVRSWVKK